MDWSGQTYVIESKDKSFIKKIWDNLLAVRKTRHENRWKVFSELFGVDKNTLNKQIKNKGYGAYFYVENIRRNAEAVTFEIVNWYGGTEHPYEFFEKWAKRENADYKKIYYSIYGEHGIHYPSYTNDVEGKYFVKANVVRGDDDNSDTVTIEAYGDSYIAEANNWENTYKSIEKSLPYNLCDLIIVNDDYVYKKKGVFFPTGKEDKYLK